MIIYMVHETLEDDRKIDENVHFVEKWKQLQELQKHIQIIIEKVSIHDLPDRMKNYEAKPEVCQQLET